MKQNVSSKKKILIAASLLGVFLVGAIVSIVLVLAANTQNIASNITVSYNAEGVAAKVSANYAVVPLDTSTSITKTAMTTSGGGQELVFNLSTGESTETISPEGDITLNPQNQKVVFEYVFENIAESAFSLSLSQRPAGINMTETYYVSGTQLAAGDYRTRITNTSLAPQAMTNLGQKIYVYIMASVTNVNLTASYNGGFVWSMVARDTIDVTLNIDGATSTLRVIPNMIAGLGEIAMPVLNTLPTKTDYNFDGYYTAANSGGTQYINKYGASSHIADLTAGSTLYAGWNQELLDVENTVVYGLTGLGENSSTLEIPSDVTEISEGALEGSSAEVITYEGAGTETAAYADATPALTIIGTNAFANCTNLKEIYIPSTVTSFGTSPLAGCTALEKIEFPYILGDGTRDVNAFSQLFGANAYIPASLKEIIINSGTIIGDFAFYDCSNITSVIIPEGVVSIGGGAFEYCSSITNIVIPSTVVFIEGAALSRIAATNVVLPEGITSIENYTFAHCSNLVSVNIPEGVTNIGSYAFYGCSSLTDTSIPSGVTSIGEYAFIDCSSLTNITIPASVTSIGQRAFRRVGATTIVFENTSNWVVSTTSTFDTTTSISSSNLSNTTTAATYLKTTYYTYYWKRTA